MLNDTIRKLLILQDRDIAYARAQKDSANIPREEEAIARQLAHNSQTYEQKKLATQKLEAERKDLELQVESKKTQIARYSTQQLQTKKNEEYQALGNEIARAQEDIRQLEDTELELMERYETAQAELKTEAVEVAKYTKHAETQRGNLRTRAENLKNTIAQLEQDIAQAQSQIDPPVLERYRRIMNSKKDVAVVEVVRGDTCNGCHMKIPHQTALQAKAMQELTVCDECGRILYWADML